MKGRVTKSFTGPLGTYGKGAIIDITPKIAAYLVPSGLVEVIREERTTASKKASTRKTTARTRNPKQ